MWCQMTGLCQFYKLKKLNLQYLLNDKKNRSTSSSQGKVRESQSYAISEQGSI